MNERFIANFDEVVLITGANGFIGTRVVQQILSYGFKNIRCFVRPTSNTGALKTIIAQQKNANIEVVEGNLLSRNDCDRAAHGAAIIYHLAAGIEKTFPGSFLNSVVTTRNLLDSATKGGRLKRFLNVSSFAVYSNMNMRRGALLNEDCEVEPDPVKRFEPYVYAKMKQDELIMEYNKKYNIPYVIVRPGAVYGPGKDQLSARIGIDTFGFFLHLGGSNTIPLTYVDNCAEAMVLAGITKGVDGHVFNIVDDDLPTSRRFLKMYKKQVRDFRSLYVPYRLFYLLCFFWERYADWSKGQLPPVFNRRRCAAYWKGNRYSNQKLKDLLGWKPRISFADAADRYFRSMKAVGNVNA